MTERRDLERFGHQATVESLLIGLPAMAALGFMFADWPERGLTFWIAAVAFASTIVGLFLLPRFRKRYTQCPNCSALLTRPTLSDLEAGDPVCFVCKNCDIEWDTGLRTPDVR